MASKHKFKTDYMVLSGLLVATVFWLIGHQLVTAFDWRTTYWIFAALNLFLAAPLCYVGLARREPPDTAPQAASATTSKQPVREPLEGRARTIAMALFCLVMSGNALIFGVGAVHLPPAGRSHIGPQHSAEHHRADQAHTARRRHGTSMGRSRSRSTSSKNCLSSGARSAGTRPGSRWTKPRTR